MRSDVGSKVTETEKIPSSVIEERKEASLAWSVQQEDVKKHNERELPAGVQLISNVMTATIILDSIEDSNDE